MFHSLPPIVHGRSLHGLDRYSQVESLAVVPVSKTHPKVDLPTQELDRTIAMKVIALERRGLVLFGVCLERHLVDMFV